MLSISIEILILQELISIRIEINKCGIYIDHGKSIKLREIKEETHRMAY